MATISIEQLLSTPFLREEDMDCLPESIRYTIRHSPHWEWSPVGIYVNTRHPDNQPDELSGCNSVAECQPSKLFAGGSIPSTRSN
jgi:hypothetical protein